MEIGYLIPTDAVLSSGVIASRLSRISFWLSPLFIYLFLAHIRSLATWLTVHWLDNCPALSSGTVGSAPGYS